MCALSRTCGVLTISVLVIAMTLACTSSAPEAISQENPTAIVVEHLPNKVDKRQKPTDTPAPTSTPIVDPIDEYAEWCAQWEARSDESDTETWGDMVEELKKVIDAYEDMEPPEELEDYHTVNLKTAKALLEIVKEKDGNQIVNEFELFLQPGLFAIGAAIMSEEDKLGSHIRTQLVDAGCIDDSQDINAFTEHPEPTRKPEVPLTGYSLGEPIVIDAGSLGSLFGEPELSGEIILTFTSVVQAESIDDNFCGTGSMDAKGIFIAIFYALTNEANSRVQPATQINSDFVLMDDRDRRWTVEGVVGHCFLEANFAEREGGDGPEHWVGPGFMGRTTIVFDAPYATMGLRLISEELGIEVQLTPGS